LKILGVHGIFGVCGIFGVHGIKDVAGMPLCLMGVLVPWYFGVHALLGANNLEYFGVLGILKILLSSV
jgi:hypothetical protein